jgi:hypothetical protein
MTKLTRDANQKKMGRAHFLADTMPTIMCFRAMLPPNPVVRPRKNEPWPAAKLEIVRVPNSREIET